MLALVLWHQDPTALIEKLRRNDLERVFEAAGDAGFADEAFEKALGLEADELDGDPAVQFEVAGLPDAAGVGL